MISVCPRCDQPLTVLSWRALDMDVCPSCRGIWLDQGEIEELLARAGATVDDPLLRFQRDKGHRSPSARRHLCPRCDSRMREITGLPDSLGRPAVHVDKCPRGHGLWFDAGELTALVESFPPECGSGSVVAILGELLGVGATKQTEEC